MGRAGWRREDGGLGRGGEKGSGIDEVCVVRGWMYACDCGCVEGAGRGGSWEGGSKAGSRLEGAKDRGAGAGYRGHRSEDSRQSRVGSRAGSYRRPRYLDVQDVQDVQEGKADWEKLQGKRDDDEW